MKTFSVPPTEATQRTDVIDLLNLLPDNTTKLISPKDVRDAIYTLWENTMFKPTTISGSNVEYIGIDQYTLYNDSDIEWYPKTYFGQKQYKGQFIMSNDLLTQQTADFFFYNTKSPVLNDTKTAVAFLSGTGSYIKNATLAAPYIQSDPIDNQYGFYMDLNIRNTSFYTPPLSFTSYGGNINIRSEKGNISLNGLILPTYKSMVDDIDKYKDFVLTLEKGGDNLPYAVWRSPFSQSVGNIISTTDLTISAPKLNLIGYKFLDSTIVATAVGGIRAGETFVGSDGKGVDVLDMLRKIIYTYVPPKVTSAITLASFPNTQVKLIETGDSTTRDAIRLLASVIKNATQSITQVGYETDPPVTPITPFPSVTNILDGQYDAVYKINQTFNFSITDSSNYKIMTFTLSVTDQYVPVQTRKTNSILKSVYPYFYGTATYSATQSTAPTVLNRDDIHLLLGVNENPSPGKIKSYLTEPIIGNPTNSNNQYLRFTTRGLPQTTGEGKGYVYFGYPAGYPLLKRIYDYSNLDVTSSFKTYSITIDHQGTRNGLGFQYWSSKPYIFYILGETQVALGTGTWSFLFV